MHSYRCTFILFAILLATVIVIAPRGASAQTIVTMPLPETTRLTPPPDARRPSMLVPLYLSFAALQGLDVATTIRSVNRGAVEANPAMAPFIGSPAAFIGVKALASAAMIASTEQLWKHHRAAAILTMIGANVGYSLVVIHNTRVGGHAVQ
jgi:uncharacterized protein DUF5658